MEDTGNKGGRPTLYTPEMLDKAQEYISLCNDYDEDPDIVAPRNGRPHRVVKVPTAGGLARYLGVSRDTIYEWTKVHPAFSDIMDTLGAEQEDRLINNGLSGDYNPTIAKVLLTKHGYREGIDNTTNDKPIEGIRVEIVPPKPRPHDSTELQGDDSLPEEL